MPKVKINTAGKTHVFEAGEGKNLLALLREWGIEVSSTCNGNGTCGKCKVQILSGPVPEASGNEVKVLGSKQVEAGYRFSCTYTLRSDIEIQLEHKHSGIQIVTEGQGRQVARCPGVTKEFVALEKPGLSSQTADYERILKDGVNSAGNNLDFIRALPGILREQNFEVTLIKDGSRLLGGEAGNTTGLLYGVAVDVGTTTVAAYLMNLVTGERLLVDSFLNPQKKYGADVISRIKHTMDSEQGLSEMNRLIVDRMNRCVENMCKEAGISPKEIYAMTFVGNTTMMHFLLGMPAQNIAAAPFIPSVTSMLKLRPAELGIHINPYGLVCILPSVASYIGADTVGAVISTGMHQQQEMSLLIDIGTNGEIVLGGKDGLYACSSAAGPAFEGANIRNGIGSVSGAINSVSLKSGVKYTTIGDSSPIGICGTGIVDAIAEMLEVGIIDETGRIDDEWEPTSEEQRSLASNVTEIDKINAFTIAGDIAITQKDIRELQNAKAAIAAGIHVLINQAGINFGDIKNVYLAGGFGTFINTDNAIKIGLIPAQLKGKIQSVGNAAGQGAVEALLSRESLSQAEQVGKDIKYIELSGLKNFNDYYIDCMMFE